MENKEKKTLCDVVSELEFAKDNLFLVKSGIVNGGCSNTEIIDNALYSVILKIESIIEEFKNISEK